MNFQIVECYGDGTPFKHRRSLDSLPVGVDSDDDQEGWEDYIRENFESSGPFEDPRLFAVLKKGPDGKFVNTLGDEEKVIEI